MIGSLILHNQPNQGIHHSRFLVVIFFNLLFSLFVPIFDLMHDIDTIIIPFKQLRAYQNVKYER